MTDVIIPMRFTKVRVVITVCLGLRNKGSYLSQKVDNRWSLSSIKTLL